MLEIKMQQIDAIKTLTRQRRLHSDEWNWEREWEIIIRTSWWWHNLWFFIISKRNTHTLLIILLHTEMLHYQLLKKVTATSKIKINLCIFLSSLPHHIIFNCDCNLSFSFMWEVHKKFSVNFVASGCLKKWKQFIWTFIQSRETNTQSHDKTCN